MAPKKLTQEEIQSIMDSFYEAPSADTFRQVPENKQMRGMAELAVKKDGLSLQYVKKKLVDKALCDMAFNQNPDSIRYIPSEYISVEQCEEAFRYNYENFRFMPQEYINIRMYEKAVRINSAIIRYIPDEFKTSEMCMKAIEKDGMLLEFIPDRFITKDICISAVRNNGCAIKFVDNKFIDQQLCDLALASNISSISFIPIEYITQDICIKAFEFDLNLLQFIPKKYQTNSMILKAASQNGKLLEYADNRLKTQEICEKAVNNDKLAVQFVPEQLMNSDFAYKAIDVSVGKSGELLFNPFMVIPKSLLNDELILSFVKKHHIGFNLVPFEALSDEGLISAIEIDRNIFSFIPNNRKSKNLIITFLKTGYGAFDMLPKELLNNDIYKEAFKYDHKVIEKLPGNCISIKMWKEYLSDLYVGTSFESVIDKIRRDYLNDDSVLELLIKRFGFHKILTWQKKQLSGNKKKQKIIDKEMFTKYEEVYRKNSDQYDLSIAKIDTVNEPFESYSLKEYECPIIHYTSKVSVNLRKVFYISDIHLEHQLKSYYGENSAILEDIEEFIEQKIDEMLPSCYNNEKATDAFILIAGDVSHSLQLTSLFYKVLFDKWNGSVIGVLGNHELWDGHVEMTGYIPRKVDEIVADYKSRIRNFFFVGRIEAILENMLFVKYKNYSDRIITDEEILSFSDKELHDILANSTLIILGGNGYSGNNPIHNAQSGLYRGTICSLYEEKQLSNRFCNVYQKVKKCASDMTVIVLTHTPISDWSDEGYIKNWIYISGHTHNNKIIRTHEGITALSDNQVGYKPQKWHLNCVQVHGQYDSLKTLSDGVHTISRRDYCEFIKGKGINIRGLVDTEEIYVLKKKTLYMFIAKQADRLYLLKGGKIERLSSNIIQYYYDNMEKMADILRKALVPYREELDRISKEIMSIGGNGRVHGCIIDIGAYTHMWLEPTSGLLEAYFACESWDYDPFEIKELLRIWEPKIYVNYENAIRNNSLSILNKYELINKDSHEYMPALISETILNKYKEKQKRSRIMRSFQYLLDDNILRYWNDELLSKQDNESQCLLQ